MGAEGGSRGVPGVAVAIVVANPGCPSFTQVIRSYSSNVVQDEYTHDVVLALRDGRALVYDCT